MSRAPRKFDVTVYGATGFTGQTVAAHLALRAPAGIRWAVAGRSRPKLEKVLEAALAGKKADVGVVVADAADKESIDAMVAQTRVIISTVGPYAKYGTPVVDACVRFGTDYVDVTGETWWIRDIVDRYHEEAKRKGVVIVPSCGFDSLPSDILAHVCATRLRTDPSSPPIADIKVTVSRISGGVSRGTLDSALGAFDAPASATMKSARTAYGLNDESDSTGPDWPFPWPVLRYDSDFAKWQVPFIMAAANGPIVRRTQSLLSHPHGRLLRYTETTSVRSLLHALAFLTVSFFTAILLALPPVRWFARRFLFPAPGTAIKASGKTGVVMRGVAKDVKGKKVVASFVAKGDPGYEETPRMVGECALALALEREGLPGVKALGGGVLTPAVAFGDVAVRRLGEVGITVRVEE